MNKKFIKMAKNMAKDNAFDFCVGMSIDGDMCFREVSDKELWIALRDVYLTAFTEEISELLKSRKREIEKEGGL